LAREPMRNARSPWHALGARRLGPCEAVAGRDRGSAPARRLPFPCARFRPIRARLGPIRFRGAIGLPDRVVLIRSERCDPARILRFRRARRRVERRAPSRVSERGCEWVS
jgi:hypothetical protein